MSEEELKELDGGTGEMNKDWIGQAVAFVVICLSALGIGFISGLVWHDPPPPAPIAFSLEGAGICKATGGGKTWLVVDMTHEFLLPEEVEKMK